ncbi:uncharacterized protein LOC144663860 isoform X1 [Oculina patagonica]
MVVFQPSGKCVLRSSKPCDLSSCTKREIKEYFENSFDLYETLFLALKDESAFYKCPDRLRLPLIFYFGHTAAVYVNKLVLGGLLKKRINFHFETLFELGVDEMSWDDTENYRMGGKFVWPKVSEVAEYRKLVRQVLLDIIENNQLELPVTQESKWWAVFMGIEHERLHFETSSVLIRQMPLELVKKPPGWMCGPVTTGVPVFDNPLIQTTQCEYVNIGKQENFPSYGWDNEYGQWKTKVPPFKASKYLVTNREYLEFVNDEGYENCKFWTEEGWKWKQFRKARHPTFWVCGKNCKSGCGADLASHSHCNLSTDDNRNSLLGNGNKSGVQSGEVPGGNFSANAEGFETKECSYKFRSMYELMDMPLDWPVEVNYHEAKAFCAWKGSDYRLPTEAEHHVMRGSQKSQSTGTACDIIFQDKIEANIDMSYGSSTPVNLYPPSNTGFCDVFGNVWEWCEDHFNGLDGFRTHFLYNDFSAPFFDGRHNMIMGGSWATTGTGASRFGRYYFRRHFFQHLGFRVALSVDNSPPVRLVGTPVFVLGFGIEDNPVTLPGVDKGTAYFSTSNSQYFDDTEEFLSNELVSHYGDLLGVESNDHASKQLAQICGEVLQKYKCPAKIALDVMCSVGRFSYELSKHVEKVVAVDHSGRLLDAAINIQRQNTVEIKSREDLRMPVVYVPLNDLKTSIDRIQFRQFTWLPNEIGVYDLIVMSCLHRLSNPKAWLIRLWEIVQPNGLVVIKTDDGWDMGSLNAILGNEFNLLEKRVVSSKRKDLGNSDSCQSTITIWRLRQL